MKEREIEAVRREAREEVVRDLRAWTESVDWSDAVAGWRGALKSFRAQLDRVSLCPSAKKPYDSPTLRAIAKAELTPEQLAWGETLMRGRKHGGHK